MGKVKASRLPEPRLIEIPSLGDHQLMRDISIQLQDAGAVDHLYGGTGRELTPRIFHGSTGFPRAIRVLFRSDSVGPCHPSPRFLRQFNRLDGAAGGYRTYDLSLTKGVLYH